MKTLYFIESINLIQPDVEEERLLGSSSTIFSICLEDINMSKEIAAKNILERFNGENNERGYDDIYRTIEIPKTGVSYPVLEYPPTVKKLETAITVVFQENAVLNKYNEYLDEWFLY